MLEFLSIVTVVVSVLQIILFFKIWGMTNDVRKLCNHFVEDNKPKVISNEATTNTKVVEETQEYDKRLDSLDVGDKVILKSTGQKVKITKTWGKDFIVNTPNGNVCIGKHEISFIEQV